MPTDYMILTADHQVVPTDLHTWASFLDDHEARVVGWTDIGDVHISTVFLGVDHSFGMGPPLWFETMVFRGPLDERQWRYTTWAEAEAGHARIVAAVESGTDPDGEDDDAG